MFVKGCMGWENFGRVGLLGILELGGGNKIVDSIC